MEVDLTKYSADNPLILEKKVPLTQQVKIFNDAYFGDLTMYDDFQLKFAINKQELIEINKERDNTFWANVENMARYFIQHVIDLGYIPWKLDIIKETKIEIIVELHCEDRRIQNRPNFETGFNKGFLQP